MPRKSLLIKTVQRECRNNYEAYQDQIFFDSGPEDKNHILLLDHQNLIQELNTEALWFVNGTFDVAPSICHACLLLFRFF